MVVASVLLSYMVPSMAWAQKVETINLIGTNAMRYTVAQIKPEFSIAYSVKGDNGKTQYLLESITVKPNQKVKVILHNYSHFVPALMSHNFVLLKKNADPRHIAAKSRLAKSNGYISPEVEDQIIAHTGIVSGGQADSVTFTTPATPGKYEFICTFPGHFSAGMFAMMIVKK